MGIDPSVLDLPLPQANEHTTAIAQAQCRELLARRHVRAGLAGRVRAQLLARAADPPDLGQVAVALNVSDRTSRSSTRMGISSSSTSAGEDLSLVNPRRRYDACSRSQRDRRGSV